MEALDIPAYRLDISAFAGQLQDGHAHTLEFSVVDADPAGSQGVWYIDPVLLLELDHAEPSPGYSGAVAPETCLSAAAAAETREIRRAEGRTTGRLRFSVAGSNAPKRSRVSARAVLRSGLCSDDR